MRLERLEKQLATPAGAPQQPNIPAPRPPRGMDPTKVYAVTLDNAVVDGPADAKVTIVVADEYAGEQSL